MVPHTWACETRKVLLRESRPEVSPEDRVVGGKEDFHDGGR